MLKRDWYLMAVKLSTVFSSSNKSFWQFISARVLESALALL